MGRGRGDLRLAFCEAWACVLLLLLGGPCGSRRPPTLGLVGLTLGSPILVNREDSASPPWAFLFFFSSGPAQSLVASHQTRRRRLVSRRALTTGVPQASLSSTGSDHLDLPPLRSSLCSSPSLSLSLSPTLSCSPPTQCQRQRRRLRKPDVGRCATPIVHHG